MCKKYNCMRSQGRGQSSFKTACVRTSRDQKRPAAATAADTAPPAAEPKKAMKARKGKKEEQPGAETEPDSLQQGGADVTAEEKGAPPAAEGVGKESDDDAGGAESDAKRNLIKKVLGRYSKLVDSEAVLQRLEDILSEGDEEMLATACGMAEELAPKLACSMHSAGQRSKDTIQGFQCRGYDADDVQASLLLANKDGTIEVDMVKMETLAQEKAIAEYIMEKFKNVQGGSPKQMLKALKKAAENKEQKEARAKAKAAAKAASQQEAKERAAERIRLKEQKKNQDKAVDLASTIASELRRVAMLRQGAAGTEAATSLETILGGLKGLDEELEKALSEFLANGADLADTNKRIEEEVKRLKKEITSIAKNL